MHVHILITICFEIENKCTVRNVIQNNNGFEQEYKCMWCESITMVLKLSRSVDVGNVIQNNIGNTNENLHM